MAKPSACGADVYITELPWCLTVIYKGIKPAKVELVKSGTTEYMYAFHGKEEGPRAETASANHTNSTVMVTFDTLEKTDMALWMIKVMDSGMHTKSFELNLESLKYLGIL